MRFKESMIHSGRFTSQMAVAASRRITKKIKKEEKNPMMNPTTETKMMTSLAIIL